MEPLAQQEVSEPVGKALKSGEKATKQMDRIHI